MERRSTPALSESNHIHIPRPVLPDSPPLIARQRRAREQRSSVQVIRELRLPLEAGYARADGSPWRSTALRERDGPMFQKAGNAREIWAAERW
ncbi:hypothetical protein Cob_v000677 [Colletotrichum orbiculare MAFF 240422]|uniref:Uncharacterized protein n=1 Tax=Colletotrichum orbiculare (strain 104-T / ATCC 96160 / CBS 514.97 / LARS 414 / MAFF 240422) TaxID=1213857 RepID=A0A484G877_COLOR|nr:hypothetical protein Cob_v000677 [Colletotrichum orbiculare MAFF 240422]